MKTFYTILVFLCSISLFAQVETNHTLEDVQQLLDLEKHQQASLKNQATLRTTFGLDSAYQTIFPSNEVNIKKYYTYNAQGGTTSSVTIKFNPNNNVWENSQKTEMERDANNVLTAVTYWDYGTDWELDEKRTFTYDAQGNQTEHLIQNWNSADQAFVNFRQTINTFDLNDNILESNFFVWSNANWLPATKTLYTYSNDTLIESLIQDYTPSSGIYTDSRKSTYTYNTAVNSRTEVQELYDQIYLTWNNIEKQELFFDNKDRVISQYDSEWDETAATPDWRFTDFISHTFDSDNNLLEDFFQKYNSNTSSWDDSRQWVYFYSGIVSTQSLNNSNVSCIFQNPSQVGQHIRCQDLESFDEYQITLFDVSGKLLLEKTFAGEGKIQLPQKMQRGVYFLNVTKEGKLAWREKIAIMN